MIRAELYRICHKKSDYIYYFSLSFLFLLFTIYLHLEYHLVPNDYLSIAFKMIDFFFVLLIGGRVFKTVYLDDLQSKKYTMVLSHRKKTVSYLFNKTVIAGINIFFVILLLGFTYSISYLLFYPNDFQIFQKTWSFFARVLLTKSLLSLVFMQMAMVLGFYCRKASNAQAAFTIFALQFILLVLNFVARHSEKIAKIKPYFLSNAAETWMQAETTGSRFFLLLLAFYIFSYLLNVLILEEKDLV